MILRQFFEYYRPWKALFFLDFGCAVMSGLLELAFPLAIKGFIDVLLPSGNLALTLWAAVGLLVIYLINAGLMVIVTYWGHKLGINIETEMRRRAFAHLQRLSFGYFDKVRTGKLVARVTRDLEEIGEVAHHGPEDLFIAIMTFVGRSMPGLLILTAGLKKILAVSEWFRLLPTKSTRKRFLSTIIAATEQLSFQPISLWRDQLR